MAVQLIKKYQDWQENSCIKKKLIGKAHLKNMDFYTDRQKINVKN